MEEKDLIAISNTEKGRGDRGKSKLLSPEPLRKKYMTELLNALAENKLSIADVTKMDRKKMKSLAEQGYIKLKHGRYEDARKIFEILTFIDNKNFFHHLALGGAYHKLKKFLDAVFQYTECLKYDPSNTNAMVNRGEIFFKHKNFKRAANDFRSAIETDKVGRDLFANRARSLVIAIKRSLAKQKGQLVKLPESPGKRVKVAPLALLGKGKVKKK